MYFFILLGSKMVNHRNERLILTSSLENQSLIPHSQIRVNPTNPISISVFILQSNVINNFDFRSQFPYLRSKRTIWLSS